MESNRYCSIPDIGNFRIWFERNFKDICIEHDYHYAEKDIGMVHADFIAMRDIFKRKKWFGMLLFPIYPFALPLTLYYWYIKN